MPIKKIKKRDGRIVDFDSSRIRMQSTRLSLLLNLKMEKGLKA